MRTINFESDFKLTVKPKQVSNLSDTPFELVFYTKKAVKTYTASYDGKEYTNCYPSPVKQGAVVVVFDNHELGLGVLWVDVHLPLSDKDFADGICNYRSTEPTGYVLDKGATEEVELSIDIFPFIAQGEDGKSAYELWLEQGNEGTVEDYLNSLKGADGKDGASFYEVNTTPKETPIKNEIAIDPSNGKIYFGIANKGWWFVTAKQLGSASVVGDVLMISGEYYKGTLAISSGEVKDRVLTL